MPIDYKEYPKNWKNEIRPAVLQRAGNKCEWCGLENHAVIKREKNGFRRPTAAEWDIIHSKVRNGDYSFQRSIKFHGFSIVVLTIAHLDHDKSNHDVELSRLAALCQKCHLGHDIGHHVANRKYGRNHRQQPKLDL